jgi:hypothetical protein
MAMAERMSENGMSITAIACLVVALQRTIGWKRVSGYPPLRKGFRALSGLEELMRQICLQPLQRLWLSLKREEVYLKEHESVREAVEGIVGGCRYYNHERSQRGLGNHTPAGVYLSRVTVQRNELAVSR